MRGRRREPTTGGTKAAGGIPADPARRARALLTAGLLAAALACAGEPPAVPDARGAETRATSFWMASIGTPAAILPRIGSDLVLSACASIPTPTRLGRKACRPPGGAETDADSGSFKTSRARARWASRRMKPRSSRAEISL